MSLWGDLMTANLSRSAWLFDLLQFGSFKGLTRKHRPSRGHSWRAIQDTHHTRGKPIGRLMLNGRLDSKSSHTTRVGQDVPICKIRQIHKIANNTTRRKRLHWGETFQAMYLARTWTHGSSSTCRTLKRLAEIAQCAGFVSLLRQPYKPRLWTRKHHRAEVEQP